MTHKLNEIDRTEIQSRKRKEKKMGGEDTEIT